MPAAQGRTRGRRPDQSRRAAMGMLTMRYWGDRLGEDDRPERLAPLRMRSTPAGWRLRPGSTAGSGRAGSSTGDSGRDTTSRRTGTSGCGQAAGAVRGAACRRGPGVARLLLAGAWGWMCGQLRFWTTTARAEIREPRLEMLSSPLVRLLEAAGHELREEIVAALRRDRATCWAVHARERRAPQCHDRPGMAGPDVGGRPAGDLVP